MKVIKHSLSESYEYRYFTDNKAKVRFDKFQTMSEAKYGLKFLFAKANKVHKEKMQIQYKLTEIQDSLDDVSNNLYIYIYISIKFFFVMADRVD